MLVVIELRAEICRRTTSRYCLEYAELTQSDGRGGGVSRGQDKTQASDPTPDMLLLKMDAVECEGGPGGRYCGEQLQGAAGHPSL